MIAFTRSLTLLTVLATIWFADTSYAQKKGGTLIFARGGDSVGLDPASETDGESLNVTDQIFDGLVSLKLGTTEVEPALAESWNISKDGLTYTFKLRSNVKFHDGTPFNADAVLYSFQRQMDKNHPAHGYATAYEYFSALGFDKLISKVAKTSDHEVVFTLTRPDSTFLSTLAMQSFAIVSPTAMEKHKKNFRMNPVGTGAFVFVRWEKNQKITLKANPDYWDGRPHIDQLIIRSVPDNNTRLLEMLSAKVHVMDNPSPDDLKVLESKMKDRIEFAKMPGMNIGYLAMNNEKKPFDNLRVRQAINHAINKKAIVDAVYSGYAQVAKNTMPPTLWGHNNKVTDFDYNPEKSKKLLKEAGYADGFETTLWAMPVPRPYMPNGRKVAEAIQGDLAKVGIKAKIVSYEWGTYLDKTKMGEHDMALLGWTGDIGDPDNFLYVLLDKDNAVKPAQNIAFYKSDKVHSLLAAAKVEPSQSKRAGLYEKAQELIATDAPLVNIAHSIEVIPHLKNVKGYVMDPTGRRRFAKVWLE